MKDFLKSIPVTPPMSYDELDIAHEQAAGDLALSEHRLYWAATHLDEFAEIVRKCLPSLDDLESATDNRIYFGG